MYTPIYLIPDKHSEIGKQLQKRWDTPKGKIDKNRITELIKNGAGEDFLLLDFQNKRFSVLENESDLRGLEFNRLDITFPQNDNFEGMDFSYCKFSQCTLKNAVFNGCNFNYTLFISCKFIECTFLFTKWFACEFRNGADFINCKFIEHNNFSNCEFWSLKFEKPSITERIFFDCKFDNATIIDDPVNDITKDVKKQNLLKKELSNYYAGIKEGFLAGKNRKEAIKYYLLSRQNFRKNNLTSSLQKMIDWLLEKIIGYGFKPLNTFLFIVILFTALTLFQLFILGFRQDVIIYSAGSFFTFGANSDILNSSPILSKVLYIIGSFLGIGSTALFITILANYFFGEIH